MNDIQPIIDHDERILRIYWQEYKFYHDLNCSWREIENKIDLKKFYNRMQELYESYRKFGDKDFLYHLKQPYYEKISLDSLIRVCHLSPFVYYDLDDIPVRYSIFEQYCQSHRLELINIARMKLLNQELTPF
jgi:hypothetical protein